MEIKNIVAITDDAYKIIGDNALTLQLHYRLISSGTGDWPERELQKNFTQEVRAKVAALYKKLRDAGFYPSGFEKGRNGIEETTRIRFFRVVPDRVELAIGGYEPFDTPISELSIPELRKRSRNLFRKMTK